MKKRHFIIIAIIIIIIGILLIWLLWPLAGASQKIKFSVIGDVDNDGLDEKLVVLEKRGYYGPDLPFWLDKNIDDYGNHLFVYKLETGEPELQWGSSTIPHEIFDMEIKDVDNDGLNDLAVSSEIGDYVMEWRDFGFREK
ncbi:hypothetical protein KKC88_05405 [Patescibacteria group bacterium]|nr:hypothetical protein [Patescibacteria group bacterium]MBU1673057.1 hypothetical protein [Patescibacteria group bacterium]MBU1963663.1 hypothetical protein [Patescibacteria group bacterium]